MHRLHAVLISETVNEPGSVSNRSMKCTPRPAGMMQFWISSASFAAAGGTAGRKSMLRLQQTETFQRASVGRSTNERFSALRSMTMMR